MLLADAYLHRLDEFAVQFTDMVGVRWYALSYLAGFVIAWFFCRWLSKTGRSPLTADNIGDLLVYIMAGVMLGGRIGYALFYDQSLLGFTNELPFWNMLAIHKGGMASHGGMLGVIVAMLLFQRRHTVSGLHLMDIMAIISAPGLGLGRIANFVNAELWGRALPAAQQTIDGAAASPAWSVKYPQELASLTEADIDRFARLEPLEQILNRPMSDERFIEMAMRAAKEGNAEVIETIRPMLTAFYPSQLIQAVTDGPILFLLLAIVWWKPRKPGVVGCWFLILYGVMRIATEVVRQPDEGVSLLLGLSRGQLLSVLMIVAGLVILPLVSRRAGPKLGGLGPAGRGSAAGAAT